MARKMGRIQAYEYWSEQYHWAGVLVKSLYRVTQSGDRRIAERQKAGRLLPMARRRQARMLALAERYEHPTPRRRS